MKKLLVTLSALTLTSLLGASAAWAQEPEEEPPPADEPAPAAEAAAEPAPEAASAAPAGQRYPVAYTARPLTLPEMVAAPEFGFNVSRISIGSFNQTFVGMNLGGSFGVMDDLEGEISLVPLWFTPDFQYNNIILGGTYRFLSGDIEVGGRLRFHIPVQQDFVVHVGVPTLIRLGEGLRFDTGLNLSIFTGAGSFLGASGGDAGVGMFTHPNYADPMNIVPGIPLRLTAQVADEIYVGGGTGFGIGDFSNAGDTIFVPLGLHGGYTLPGDDGAMLDIGARFEMPLFLTPASSGDKVNPGIFSVGLTAKYYIYL